MIVVAKLEHHDHLADQIEGVREHGDGEQHGDPPLAAGPLGLRRRRPGAGPFLVLPVRGPGCPAYR
jgi:hypothetical protein